MRGRRTPALPAGGLALAALFAAPLAYLLTWAGGDPLGVVRVWASRQTLAPLGRTLLLATTVSAATAVLGTALAWVTARTDVPGRRVWRLLLPLPLVIPSFIGAFSLIAAFAPGGLLEELLAPLGVRELPQVRGFWGAFVVLTLLTYPYVYLPVAARLRQLPPSLEESARLLGRSPLAAFRDAVLPQSRGAVLAGTLLVFLYSVSEFGVVQLMRYDTLTRTIYASRLFQRERALTLSLLLGVLAVVIAAAERWGRGREHGTARGRRALQVPLGRWRGAALALVAGTALFALIAPLAVLLFWAVRGVLRGDASGAALAADLTDLARPALNTAGVSVAAAVAAVLIVLPVAYLTVRRRGWAADVSNALIVGGFALPGLVVALALAHWSLSTDTPVALLYQTQALLVLAYVVHFGAQALRTAQVALQAMPPGVEDAARMLGARRIRRLLRVELPLMAPGLLAGGGLVLLSAMKELPATLLLAPPGFQTLATTVWTATEDAFLGKASLAAILLVLLSAGLTWALVLRQSDAME